MRILRSSGDSRTLIQRLLNKPIPEQQPPNPNPNKYKKLREAVCGPYVVLMLQYKGCTTYNGRKVLVYDNYEILATAESKEPIDPHFLGTRQSPIARFPGDQKGWEAAKKYVSFLADRPCIFES